MKNFGSDLNRRPHFAFVDASNVYSGLEGALKTVKLPKQFIEKLDPSRLVGDGFDRVYLYHGKANGEALPKWLEEWRSQQGVILRLGRTTQKRTVTKQEGVDVLLAVEALRCSHQKTMASCTIFSEDGDFLPLVDALVANGTFTYIKGFNDPNQGTVRPELRNRADGYSRYSNAELFGALRERRSTILVQELMLSRNHFETHAALCGDEVRLKQEGSCIRLAVDFDQSESGQVRTKGFTTMDQLELWYALRAYRPNC